MKLVQPEPLARHFINNYQGGFPLVERPFSRVAEQLSSTEDELIDTVSDLLDAGYLSRFGPLYDAAKLGGHVTLAAMSVTEVSFDSVAAKVNSFDAVAHNYRRDHALNMWFVVASDSRDVVEQTLQAIEKQTGMQVYDFPKEHEFYLGLWLYIDEQGRSHTVPVPESKLSTQYRGIDGLDRDIINITQAGLPLHAEPFKAIGKELGVAPGEIMRRLADMLDQGVIRRIGAVPNHYRLGLRGNGMTVWDVPDEKALELGKRIGKLDYVSHCYLRPRIEGIWPYNLFAMVHGADKNEVLKKADQLAQLLAGGCRAHDVLFSSAILKKTGLRIAA